MTQDKNINRFIKAAKNAGADVKQIKSLLAAANYIAKRAKGTVLLAETSLTKRHGLLALLTEAGVDIFVGEFRQAGQLPNAGITFSNFCLADTGTVVLDSTDEDIRLATSLPEMHFILVDPQTILKDNLAAIKPMNTFHQGNEPKFIAYITGPSRTADIERVLTIGCHGPREVHILLLEGISSDFMEN